MPNAEARAAFNTAQKIAADMRDIHAQEQAASEALNRTQDRATREAFEDELIRICGRWTRLHGDYTKAFAAFTAAVQKARGG